MFAFVDVETTGFDPEDSQLLEVAILVANDKFEVVEEIVTPIQHTNLKITEWTYNNLNDCIKRSFDSQCPDLDTAQWLLINFMQKHFPVSTPAMCGNSLTLDRNFLKKYMPYLYSRFHYRSIDVTSFMVARRTLGMETCSFGEPTHRAIEDCRRSLKQLQWYMEKMQ